VSALTVLNCRITDVIEITCLRQTAVNALFYHIRNEEIFEELKMEPVDDKRRRYKSN
jgi:hypothetical protein